MIIALTLLVAIAGLIMFLGCTNTNFKRIGEIMFFCGLLAFLLNGGPALVKLLGSN